MRVDFYHLLNAPLDKVLPALVERVYALDKRLLIRTGMPERAEYLNTLLWTYRPDSWLPHGSDRDGFTEDQPVLITGGAENGNKAEFVMLVDGGNFEEIQDFERCFNLFDGRDEQAVEQARGLWKAAVAAGAEAYYWQQDDASGKWVQKASKNVPG